MKINELHNLRNMESTGILHNEANLNKQGFAAAERLNAMGWDATSPGCILPTLVARYNFSNTICKAANPLVPVLVILFQITLVLDRF